ncbi:MAG: GxxExxY protein [Anaerolineales bacterium]|nr:GxxExxY protein [Anaerolineales bacterium]MBX3038877.1 GxxExxY protein [Anaerolineales bacterium]
MSELIYKDEVFAIVGAAIEVHSLLGSGFLEAVYQEAMEIESSSRKIPFVSQQVLQIQYKQHVLKKEYIADMICFDKIIVEFKALDKLTGREESQIINYLKATGYKVGVLINFGSHPKLEWKRFVY